jgi:hypothetical protein
MYIRISKYQRTLSKQSVSDRAKPVISVWWCVCIIAALLLCGCGGGNPNKAAEDEQLANERKRIEAEKNAEHEAAERELIARNLPAKTPSEALWKQYRKTFPYHSQVLALSAPSSDGSRTLIVSEPPPHATLGEILIPVGNLLLNHSVRKQEIGYDGWAKDVVIALSGTDKEMASLMSSLNQLLFGTSYKSYVVSLPAQTPTVTPIDLDLKVTTNELKNWILDDNEVFIPVEGGEGIASASVFTQPDCGVYYSGNPGLVTWWIPKERTVQDCRIQARQFALDSDLIVGAISKGTGILVLGRERIVPLDVLPPLRVETLSLLASVQKGQEGMLAQSYERKHPFAGPIGGNKDWAPIYLSPELVDTEYGSLLNITDQLLKGWSNNGETQYVNFTYPRPAKWPAFRVPLPKRLRTKSMIYNWNTKGAGYEVNAGEYKLMALYRTGALPVTYIPEEMGETDEVPPHIIEAEDEGYDYFAGVSDPNLVRVVQYAAMYQIFSAFDVAKTSNTVPTNTIPKTVLDQMTNGIFLELSDASPQEMAKLSRQLLALIAPEVPPEFRGAEYNLWQLELIRDKDEPADSKDKMFKRLLMSKLAALKKFPERYAKEIGDKADSGDNWIHTPVVVISQNRGLMGAWVGGHNLNAKVTRFKYSEEVAPGQTRVDINGDILINPRDAGKVSSVVRMAGRNEEHLSSILSRLDETLASSGEIAPRARPLALNLPSTQSIAETPSFNLLSTARGTETSSPVLRAGWGRFQSRPAVTEGDMAILQESRQATPGSVVVARQQDGIYRIIHSEKSSPVEAFTSEDASDMVVLLLKRSPKDSSSLQLELRGFASDEATAFIRSCEIRATGERIPKEISAFIREKNLPNESILRMQAKKYDFSRAEIKVSEVETLPVGTQRSVITVEVPTIESGASRARATVELRFGKSTPREVIRIVTERIKQAIKNLLDEMGDKYDVIMFNRRLNLEIKRINKETGVDVDIIRHQFSEEMGDLYFSRRDQRGEFNEAGAAAGNAT